ncbi:hypothetical protein F5Y15DRAFT_242737 [Xylariaceae sp. FL0016]|nr:hypothetical protein F5Y15DRAFT_242737 [Xylariaceae sp. FL0016]
MTEIITDTRGVVLPARYQIRRIDGCIRDWVISMGIEGFMLRDDSLWKPILPYPKVGNALRAFTYLAGHYDHSIYSGLSYCIVDTQYTFRRPESVSVGGWLYWDELDPDSHDFERKGRKKMVYAMDFPIVCIALAFDAFSQRDYQATTDMLQLIPLQSQLGAFLGSVDPRPYETWGPTDYGQVLIRSGCVTKPGYEGRGLGTALNHFVMLEAKALGYRGLSVGLGNRSILRSYTHAPRGCRAQVLAHWNFEDVQLEDEEGAIIMPYRGTGMRDGWEVWVDLTG